jgi:tRNA (cmo5U34)-methyltransferase
MQTAFQAADVAAEFVDKRRQNIPYAADQICLLLQLIEHFSSEPKLIVDLGCGDGILGRSVMTAYPDAKAIMVDHSEPMLEHARKAAEEAELECEFVQGDMAQPLNSVLNGRRPDLVVSGYAIHHLPDDRKLSLYQEIYDALSPGGMFVNVEHVASPSIELEKFWENACIGQIVENTEAEWDEVAEAYYARPDMADNILAPVETQIAWLRKIGFEQADCYFKFLELAVFGGVKPA